ncbi:hypothetical protein MCOR25_002883 [Pyricularia grisea]|uniref:Uncharacterized protein n=1 Tax=Pyricularia grisea TaxID=148305 RepID=A0A6P8BG45_PYRGI|nr:uncharacterized protein PgNI_01184 [Pyricularia grisea]KAI6376068.1 hypothetical protein MCOR25_002883 [Pyricularia grisea]TLD15604.1 hypothetical protein PgNI_01184 [Pyricularia grisea]
MHYPTLYAFLLATAVPTATSLAIRNNHRQESASSVIADIARRNNEENDEATFARLKRTQDDLNGQEDDDKDEADPYSLGRRGDDAPEMAGFTQEDLDSVLDPDSHSNSQSGIKHRRRRAIEAFVRRSGRPIPTGALVNHDMPLEEKRGLLENSGTTSVIKADESDEIDVDNYGDDDDEEHYEERKKRLSRRGISAMIARRRVKRTLSR